MNEEGKVRRRVGWRPVGGGKVVEKDDPEAGGTV